MHKQTERGKNSFEATHFIFSPPLSCGQVTIITKEVGRYSLHGKVAKLQ